MIIKITATFTYSARYEFFPRWFDHLQETPKEN